MLLHPLTYNFTLPPSHPPHPPGLLDHVKDVLSYKQEWGSIRDKDGATPLIHAANRGYKEVGF